MTSILRFTLFITFSFFSICNLLQAQPIKGRSIEASIGLGVSAPYEDIDIDGTGFYLQGEYVMAYTKWFGLRPYLAAIFTSSEDYRVFPDDPDYEVTANAVLLGTKFRLAAPIPWIAPYIESGVGVSIGTFRTFIPLTDIERKGLSVHVPFALGLALGPQNNVEVEFAYYFHPAAEQFVGAAAIGISIPLR